MGLIVTLIVFVALAVIIVWIADWASGARRSRALSRGTVKSRNARSFTGTNLSPRCYESTRVNPTPAIAASIAASAVFTLSRERIAIAFLDLPAVNVHPLSEDNPSKTTQS